MSDLTLRPAEPGEAGTISKLALRSKGHWGYSAEFLASCRDELTTRPEQCDGVHLVVAERDGDVVGFHRWSGEPPDGTLESLFVDPSAIGSGAGRLLFDDAVARAKAAGMTSLQLESDPGAEPFYLHMGARRIGETPSGSIPGRVLPKLRLEL